MMKKLTCALMFLALGAGTARADYQMREYTESLAWSADGKTLIAAGGRLPWEPDSNREFHYGPGGEATTVYLWDVAAGTAKKPIAPDADRIAWEAVALTPDGKRLMAGTFFWDVASHKPTRGVRVYALSKDGKRMVDKPSAHLRVLETASGKVLCDGEMIWTAVSLSQDGKYVAAIGEHHLKIWKVDGCAQQADVYIGGDLVTWSADGQNVAVVSASDDYHADATIYGKDGKVVTATVTIDAPVPRAAVWSPDGKWLAVGATNGISWLRQKDLSVWATWGGDAADAISLAYNPDGKTIAVGHSTSGLIQILDATADKVKVVKTLKTPVYQGKPTDPDPYAEHDPDPDPVVAEVKQPEVKEPEVKEPEVKQPEVKEPEQPKAPVLTDAQKEALEALQQSASYAAVGIGYVNAQEHVSLALDYGKDCQDKLKKAKATGLPDSTVVDFNVYDSGVTAPQPLGKIDALLCKPLMGSAGTAVDSANAAEAARYAPYLKVLSGDKAKIFQEQHMVDAIMFGKGKKRLKTPADFKNATAWYYFVHVQNVATPTWEVEGWIFKGMKKVKVYDKQGPGDDPPASAFK